MFGEKFRLFFEKGKEKCLLTKNGKNSELSTIDGLAFLEDKTITSLTLDSENKNPFLLIYEDYEESVKNKKGLFSEQVILKTKKFTSTQEPMKDDQYNEWYSGDIEYVFNVISAKTGEELGNTSGKLVGFTSPTLITEKNLVDSLTCRISGIYASPYDYDNFRKTLYEITKRSLPKSSYYCEECNLHFTEIDDFLKHLDETKHYDSFLEKFPYYFKK